MELVLVVGSTASCYASLVPIERNSSVDASLCQDSRLSITSSSAVIDMDYGSYTYMFDHLTKALNRRGFLEPPYFIVTSLGGGRVAPKVFRLVLFVPLLEHPVHAQGLHHLCGRQIFGPTDRCFLPLQHFLLVWVP